MTHMIDMSLGKPASAWVGETPWHALGTLMDPKAPLEDWQVASGNNWDALEAPIVADIDGVNTPVTNRKVLYRSDTKRILSVVNQKYKVVQPTEIFEFYRDLVEENGFTMETAGALRGGRTIWALARVPAIATHVSIPEEEIRPFLLLSTSFDYASATVARLCAERVVCHNTLSIALSETGKRVISVPHSRNWDGKKVKIELDLYAAVKTFTDTAIQMAETPVDEETAVRFFLEIYTGSPVPTGEAAETRLIQRLSAILRGGPGATLPTAYGTVWGLLNAVTHDVDFAIKARNQDNRLSSAWFGPGERRKHEAFRLANSLLQA